MTLTNDDQLLIDDARAGLERATLLLGTIRHRRRQPGGLMPHEQAMPEATHDILTSLEERLENNGASRQPL